MKTEYDIRNDLFSFLSGSELKNCITGKIFKYEEERPDKSDKEDLVIAPLSETPFAQVQETVVMIRIYVRNLFDKENNLYRANGIRLNELENLCKKVLKVFRTDEARCTLDTIKTYKVQGREERCLVNRIIYKHCNY